MNEEPQIIGNPLELAVWVDFKESERRQDASASRDSPTPTVVANRLQNFIMTQKRNVLVKAYDELPASIVAEQAKFASSGPVAQGTSHDVKMTSSRSPQQGRARGFDGGVSNKFPSRSTKPTAVKEFKFSTRARVKRDEETESSRSSVSSPSPRARPSASSSQNVVVAPRHKDMFVQELSALRASNSAGVSQPARQGRSPARSCLTSGPSRASSRSRADSSDSMPAVIAGQTKSPNSTPRKSPTSSTKSPTSTKLSPHSRGVQPKYATLGSPVTPTSLQAQDALPLSVSSAKTPSSLKVLPSSSKSPQTSPEASVKQILINSSPITVPLSVRSPPPPPPPQSSQSPPQPLQSPPQSSQSSPQPSQSSPQPSQSSPPPPLQSSRSPQSPPPPPPRALESPPPSPPESQSPPSQTPQTPPQPRKRAASVDDRSALGEAEPIVSSGVILRMAIPPAVVYAIMHFFDMGELASAARVCREWAVLADADPLWRVLNEKVRPVVLSKLEEKARKQPNLEPFLFTPVFPQRWKDAVRDTCLYSTAKPVSQDYVALIVDTGICNINFGMVGSERPHVIPSALGFPMARSQPSKFPPIVKQDGHVVLQKFPAFLAGTDLPRHRGSDSRYSVHPLFNSRDVGESDDLNTIWAYMFDSLHVDPTQHPVLSSVPLQCPLQQQASHLEMLFETFGVPAVHLELSPLLAAYGYGSATGLVIDLGASAAQILPICDGVVLQYATNRVRHLGGRMRTNLMRALLNNGGAVDLYYDTLFAREVTEKIARVSMQTLAPSWDAFANLRPTMQEQSSVSLVMGEALFAPNWILDDAEMCGIPQLVAESVGKCSMDLRPRLLNNIMLCGGSAQVPGFVDRLQQEMERLFPMSRQTIHIQRDLEPAQMAWRGGCVLAAHPAFQSSWLLKEDYDEGLR